MKYIKYKWKYEKKSAWVFTAILMLLFISLISGIIEDQSGFVVSGFFAIVLIINLIGDHKGGKELNRRHIQEEISRRIDNHPQIKSLRGKMKNQRLTPKEHKKLGAWEAEITRDVKKEMEL